MHSHQEHRHRLSTEVSATILYVSILQSHLQQITDEIATQVQAIHADYDERIEFAGGREDALRRLSRGLRCSKS